MAEDLVEARVRDASVSPRRGAVFTLGAASVELVDGLLHDWRRRNVATSIHTVEQLRSAGNLDNLRALLEDPQPAYRGRYPFLDTDLYKTLEGLAYEIAPAVLSGDPDPRREELRAFYEEAVTLVESAQRHDGYLNSYYQNDGVTGEPWSDLAWGHELYNLGHLIQAAVAANRQLGDGRLLRVAARFADLVVARYGDDAEKQVCGHPEVEMALVELYRATGRPEYLRQAQLFIDRRGHGTVATRTFTSEYFQDNVPLRQLPSVVGHAVRMAYLGAGAADVALETGDHSLYDALVRLFEDMRTTKLYVTGGLGARHSDEAVGDRYELPPERAYSETCAAIATMQWAWRMFLAHGEAVYLDVFETVLYNAYAVGVSVDGTAFFYDNPLQRRPDHEQRSGYEQGGELLRRSWFGCPCCPPNVVRWMAELQDHIAVLEQGQGRDVLRIANWTGCDIDTPGLSLEVRTGYPFDGAIRIRVTSIGPDAPRVALRVPGWADNATVTCQGSPVERSQERGWVELDPTWAVGDEITLELPLRVRGHVSHPYLDASRGTVSLARGPVVYCVEQQDCQVSVDDLVVDAAGVAAAVAREADLGPEIGTAPVIVLPGGVAPPARPEVLYPEIDDLVAPATATADVVALPYYLWGNREAGPMRVWLRTS